jgi:hypothetical protein
LQQRFELPHPAWHTTLFTQHTPTPWHSSRVAYSTFVKRMRRKHFVI